MKQVFPEVSKRTLRRDFENLLKQGIIEKIGEKNDTFYQLKRSLAPLELKRSLAPLEVGHTYYMANLRKIFSKIYDQWIKKIYRFIFLKVNSQEVAEDLTSETFLRGWQAFKEKSEEIENPSAFLYQIARNLVIDHYREKGKNKIVSVEFLTITDPNPGPEEKMALSSEIEKIRQAMSGLKPNYQNIIIWHYLDDLSIPEIAKILDKSEGAVRVLLHRGLRTLRTKMNNDGK